MKASAIKKAKRRYRHATDSLLVFSDLAKGVAVDDCEQAWFQFLVTLISIPEILKTGSREDARSRQWFSAKERLIRTDPLLRYLFHARAVDFHGDERLLRLVTTAGIPAEVDHGFDRPKGNPSLNLMIPKDVHYLRIWYEPLPVRDRHGNVFNPPTALFSRSPTGMGRVALDFYKSLITEAEPFCA